jgi:predicted phosphodiesterase
MDTKLAVLADIHGNRWALEAVLAHLRARQVTRMVNLGDCVYGPLDPSGTLEILMGLDIPTVRGNQDRILTAPEEMGPSSPTLRFVMDRIGEEGMAWLAALPPTLIIDGELLLCHGTPTEDDCYLVWVVSEEGVRLRTPQELSEALAGVSERVILCGHSHVPRKISLPDGRMVVNPGSVGLPAYKDEQPYPHAMEARNPHARYAILEKSAGVWQVEHIAVSYDYRVAAEAALENGRPDWAEWLATGRAQL